MCVHGGVTANENQVLYVQCQSPKWKWLNTKWRLRCDCNDDEALHEDEPS